ncbi:LacI family DNA-binding transcriptional regulator [Amycolatopsis sp. NBC_01307]|nr:LacI family DNA-binding transcriptional regulator [Amycolatopsis sp. NBC_01307]
MSFAESPEPRPTLADVARAAGVSTATASRERRPGPRARSRSWCARKSRGCSPTPASPAWPPGRARR